QPQALYITAGVLALFMVIPGFPISPFFAISPILGLTAFRIERRREDPERASTIEAVAVKKDASENLEDVLSLEMVELEVGYGLVNIVDSDQDGDLLERISHIRKQFVTDWGIIIPSVRIRDNLELKPGEYNLKIKGIVVA